VFHAERNRPHPPKIRTIPDFPKPGILFRDLVLEACGRLPGLHGRLRGAFRPQGFPSPNTEHPDLVVGIESRGFVGGSAFAAKVGLGFVPIRKRGKRPAEVHSHENDSKRSVEVAYYLGLKADIERRLPDAIAWYRVALETNVLSVYETQLAFQRLAGWRQTGSSIARLAALPAGEDTPKF
jgi:hypothetical protein